MDLLGHPNLKLAGIVLVCDRGGRLLAGCLHFGDNLLGCMLDSDEGFHAVLGEPGHRRQLRDSADVLSVFRRPAGTTQSAVARFEAGGTVPTLIVLERLAAALVVNLKVGFEPRGEAA